MKKYLLIILSAMVLLASCGTKPNISSSSNQFDPTTSSTGASSVAPPKVEEEPPEPEAKSLEELIAMVKAKHPDVTTIYERENDYVIGDNLGTFPKAFPIVEPLEYIRGTRLVPDGIDYNEAFLRAKEIDQRLSAYLSKDDSELNTKGTRIPDSYKANDDMRDNDLNIFYRSVGAANLDGKPFYRVEVYYDTEEIFTDAYYVSADKNHNLVYLISIVDGTPILIHDSNEKASALS